MRVNPNPFVATLFLLLMLSLTTYTVFQAQAQTPAAAPAAKAAEAAKLPALEGCQAETLQLKATVVQLRQQLVTRENELAQIQLGREQERLETRFRELLKPSDKATFDWQTLTFKEPK